MSRSKAECEQTILNAMYNCARTCEETRNVGVGKDMADAVAKLAVSYFILKQITKGEDA